MRLLVVDDDRSLREAIAQGLRTQGYAVSSAADGLAAWELLAEQPWDLLILDLGLPGLDGLEILRRLRRSRSAMPVLVLSARDAPEDRIAGLDAGADDYLPKPFSAGELLARIRALLRRGERLDGPAITVGALAVDSAAHEARVAGRLLDLTPRETIVLELLAARAGRTVPTVELAERLYGRYDPTSGNAVEVLIGRLRRKLHAAAEHPLLHTRRGFGYVLAPAEPPA